MKRSHENQRCGCGCDDGVDRRTFLAAGGLAAGATAFTSLAAEAAQQQPAPEKKPAVVRVAFLYPPSDTFAKDPNGWWSWPGNDFDAEGRQRQYTAQLRAIENKLGMKLEIYPKPVANRQEAQRLVEEMRTAPPDGLLLVMFYNRSLGEADLLLAAAEALGLPAIFYVGLGVKHGEINKYRREGLYFIQSLDNFEAIEAGLRMVHARVRLRQSLLLSITEAPKPREGVEKFLGIRVRVIPFARYAKIFEKIPIDKAAGDFITAFSAGAREVRGVTREAMENAARAHFALEQLRAEEGGDALTMNCLKRGMLKPCISFSMLNSRLMPATCENDLTAAYTQMLGQLLTGRPGFQHNPCYDTERNHYYASHCTCARKLQGPGNPDSPFLLRRFAHTNEGSCAIQVFWKPDDPVTMVHYYPEARPTLDVYAGRVVESYEMPPAGGCTTNVSIRLTDRDDACMVVGHHNQLFAGDFAGRFRHFARLYKMKLAETGHDGPWPGQRPRQSGTTPRLR